MILGSIFGRPPGGGGGLNTPPPKNEGAIIWGIAYFLEILFADSIFYSFLIFAFFSYYYLSESISDRSG